MSLRVPVSGFPSWPLWPISDIWSIWPITLSIWPSGKFDPSVECGHHYQSGHSGHLTNLIGKLADQFGISDYMNTLPNFSNLYKSIWSSDQSVQSGQSGQHSHLKFFFFF